MASTIKINKGTRYNKLRFVEDLGMREGHRYGKWICDCGKEVEIQISAVKKGRIKSCGCIRRITNADFKTVKEGDVFGELTFIETAGYAGHNRIGLFKCSCGEIVEKPVTNVVHGATRSCGHILENIGRRPPAKKKYIEEKKEGIFNWDDYDFLY